MTDLIMCFMPLLCLIPSIISRALVSTTIAVLIYIARNHDVIWAIEYLTDSLLRIL
jgi:hypothetical protein